MESNQTTERKTYHEQKYIDNTLRLREILKTLPAFAKDYFRAAEPTTSAKTRISYAYDIRVFFHFLMGKQSCIQGLYHRSVYPAGSGAALSCRYRRISGIFKGLRNPKEKQITNTEKGLARKMSALRSFYGYYFKHQIIEKNPTLFVDMPKLHAKIVRLDTDEVASLLDFVEHGGDELTGQKKVYYEKTKSWDPAIITLLLGTGIRVSECVGLDIQDVDFKNNGITVVRKGGNEMVIYFGEEVEHALKQYLYTTR